MVGRQRMLMEQALPGAIDRGEMSLSSSAATGSGPAPDHRCGGAAALEFAGVRPGRSGPLHPGGGGRGCHRPDRRLGPGGGTGAGPPLARPGHRGPARVNVSAGQFEGEDFGDRVARALEHAGVPARLLELELTERVFVTNVAGHRALFDQLNELGVGLAVDDFGVGYSALSYLRDFPVHALKIDRSFVDGLPASEDDAAIVLAVIALGHTLGLRVVAEGVETRDQLEFLRAADCDEAQGFLIGSGFDAAGFDALLASGLPELAPGPAAPGR
ncbi:MAG: EAL domain-containing protein [Gammaproteobacteria bacterium]|nr:EAL domain-containing protein [Gammaproteobacteria bacterium]